MAPDHVRAALDQLRADMNKRLDRIETKLDDHAPRVAVLERRADDRDKKNDRSWQSWLAIGAATLACVGTVLQAILGG